MRFSDVLRKLGESDDAEWISAEEILAALDRSTAVDRRIGFLPRSAAGSELPPLVVAGIDWRSGAFHAKTVVEVQRVVKSARANGHRVRVAGAEHSTTE